MAKHTDPVCGMVIEEADAVGTSDYNGTRYYFCSSDCKTEFDTNPADYAETGSGTSGADSSGRGM